VEELLTQLPGGQTGFLIVVNILVFVLAFFLDYFELAFIIIPLLGPAADKLGIDLIWFGVLLAVNMQTSFMHPPFGFALFYLRSVAPREVRTQDIYWGAVPFVLIQIFMVGLIIAVPGIVQVDVPASAGGSHPEGASANEFIVDPASNSASVPEDASAGFARETSKTPEEPRSR
jgi:TRAP-type mannitol/chloroaromatic compound transport system permease large subunit